MIRFLIFMLFATAAIGQEDPRYCGPPKRDAAGVIVRSSAVLREFKKLHPCPLDRLGLRPEPLPTCPGWQIDHVIPLVCGGCDAISNLQYLPVGIKTCSATSGIPCKDRWEQRVYCVTQ